MTIFTFFNQITSLSLLAGFFVYQPSWVNKCQNHPCVVFSYTDSCTYIHIYVELILTQWITMSEGSFNKICTSHFIVRVRKGSLKVCMWEGVGDRTELQYIDPHSYGHQRCVFLVLQGCSTGGPGAQLSAGWWLPLLHLISNFSGPQLTGGPQGPLRPGVAFPTTSRLLLQLNSNCLDRVI